MQLPDLEYEPTIPSALRRAVRDFGDNEYLVMPDLRMTFADVEAASRRFARTLLANGVGKGTRVAIQFSYGADFLITFLAVTRIGAVCLPMSTSYVPAELHKSVRHGDVDLLIVPSRLFGEDHVEFVERAFVGLGDSTLLHLHDTPFLRSIWFLGDADVAWATTVHLDDDDAPITNELLDRIEAEVTPGDWLMIIHTSGTTGEPKGVIHTHGAFVRHAHNLATFYGFDEDWVQFSGLPWFWIGGIVLSVGQALAKGFTMVCINKFDEAEALELILDEKPDQVGMWPQLLQRFGQYVASTGKDLSEVPAFAPPADGKPVDPGLRHNSMGQTESMGPHTGGGPELDRILPEEMRGSFGLRVPCIEHRIIDPETGEDVPPGEEGETIVRGYSILEGLYKQERHEAVDDDGWLHTGDRGYIVGDYYYFTGRDTEMIKTSGSNVAPREVELVLEQSPQVGLAVVMGLPDADRGQVVAAVLVPMPGADVDVESVRALAEENLSRYKVPRHFMVVESDDMPKLGSGKPDKRALFVLLENDLESRRH